MLLRDKIGFLFQNYALMSYETVENNLKLAIASKDKTIIDQRIESVLDTVGLLELKNQKVF